MPISPRLPPSPPLGIEILAFPEVQLLDVAGPLQVFATANEIVAAATGARPYLPRVVADRPGIATSAGLVFAASELPGANLKVHTLLIAGGRGVDAACGDRQLIGWIRRRAAAASRVASVCSGAFLLAEAGLLDGRRAATHWGRCDEFSRRFPQVRLEPDPIFVCDGNVWTSAGITAGIDLALALVEDDLGRETAMAVARHLVVFLKRPGGQAQFSTALALQTAGTRFAHLNAWIAENLDGDMSVGRLAQVAGMSERSLLRHYRQETGTSPAHAVERIRIETARRMLEEGATVKRVVRRCGFGSEETLRRAFLRQVGVAPAAYRERFSRT